MELTEVSFKKGFNPAPDAFSCPPGSALTFSDVLLDYGTIRTRPTSQNITSGGGSVNSGNPISSMFGWTGPSSGGMFLYVISSAKLFRSSSLGSIPVTWTDITNSLAITGSNQSWAVLNGILIVALGNAISIASNSSLPANQTIPLSTIVALKTVNNMMFATDGISTITWSAVSDPTTWPGASSLTYRFKDGDHISALANLGSSLLIFKQYSIGILNTTSTTVSGTVTLGPLTTLFSGIGALGRDCVDNLPDGRVAFLSPDGNVYLTDGTIIQCLSANPVGSPSLRDYINSSGPLSATYSVLRYYSLRNEIVVSVQLSNGTWVILVYDLIQQYWYQITGFQATTIFDAGFNNGPGVPLLLIGDNNGKVFYLSGQVPGVPLDNTNSIVYATLSTAVPFPQNVNSGDQLNIIVIYKTSSQITLQYGFDGTYIAATYTIPTNANGGRYVARIPLPSLSNSQHPSSISLKFTGASAGSFSISSVYISDEIEA